MASMPDATDRPFRTVIIMLGVIFASEVAVMMILDTLPPLPRLLEASIDAVALSLILAVLLFSFVYKPIRQQIAERDRAFTALAESERRLHDIAEAADEWIWEVDASGRYTYVSPVVERILGYTKEEVLTKHFYDLFHPDDREALKEEALEYVAKRLPFHMFINRNVHKNGTSVWLSNTGVPVLDSSGELLGYRGADSLKFQESAVTDPLTGVLNRQGFYLLAEHQMRMRVRNELQLAVLFADMNGLKEINDEFGHLEGDRAIASTARLLAGAVRQSDIIARFGGDEFVVLLTAERSKDAADIVLAHIDERFRVFNESGELAFPLAVSVGLALCDQERFPSLDELVDEADKSMYVHKRVAGRR
jgi:diguanylate cyclase (GGDEF)-like protein/PAS domain S-box-containing protein